MRHATLVKRFVRVICIPGSISHESVYAEEDPGSATGSLSNYIIGTYVVDCTKLVKNLDIHILGIILRTFINKTG